MLFISGTITILLPFPDTVKCRRTHLLSCRYRSGERRRPALPGGMSAGNAAGCFGGEKSEEDFGSQ